MITKNPLLSKDTDVYPQVKFPDVANPNLGVIY